MSGVGWQCVFAIIFFVYYRDRVLYSCVCVYVGLSKCEGGRELKRMVIVCVGGRQLCVSDSRTSKGANLPLPATVKRLDNTLLALRCSLPHASHTRPAPR